MIGLAFALLSRLEHRRLIALGRAVGWLWYHVFPYRRALAERQIAAAFPDWPRARVRATARESFCQTTTTFAEFALLGRLADLPRGQKPAFYSSEGYANVRAAHRDGRGVICVTAHLGNWDLFAVVQALLGEKINVVTREIKN